jgi:hypothetical protein
VTAIYKPGDTLFERTNAVGKDRRLRRIVREWVVLSVFVDADFTDGDRPIQILTLRAWTDDRAIYQALMDVEVDSRVEAGTWAAERPTS